MSQAMEVSPDRCFTAPSRKCNCSKCSLQLSVQTEAEMEKQKLAGALHPQKQVELSTDLNPKPQALSQTLNPQLLCFLWRQNTWMHCWEQGRKQQFLQTFL